MKPVDAVLMRKLDSWGVCAVWKLAEMPRHLPPSGSLRRDQKAQRDKSRRWSFVCGGNKAKAPGEYNAGRGAGPWWVIFTPGRSYTSILTNCPGKEEKLLLFACSSPTRLMKLGFPFPHWSPKSDWQWITFRVGVLFFYLESLLGLGEGLLG